MDDGCGELYQKRREAGESEKRATEMLLQFCPFVGIVVVYGCSGRYILSDGIEGWHLLLKWSHCRNMIRGTDATGTLLVHYMHAAVGPPTASDTP